jgi:hypothetical protein
MSLILQGSTSGSITLQEPAVAGTTVLTLPAVSGNVLTDTSPKAGNVIQVQTTTTDGVLSTTTTGAPTTITNGVQVFSLSFTPISATSTILIQTSSIVVQESTNGGDKSWLALWNGSTFIAATSGHASFHSFASNLNVANLSLNNSYSAGNTSARTISVRAGMDAGGHTVYVNGNSYDNYTGSSARIQMTVWEIAA